MISVDDLAGRLAKRTVRCSAVRPRGNQLFLAKAVVVTLLGLLSWSAASAERPALGPAAMSQPIDGAEIMPAGLVEPNYEADHADANAAMPVHATVVLPGPSWFLILIAIFVLAGINTRRPIRKYVGMPVGDELGR